MATSGVYNYDPNLGSLFLSAFGRDQIKRLDDGQTFKSIKAAAVHYGINKSYLQRVVKGEFKSNVARGFRFQEIRQ